MKMVPQQYCLRWKHHHSNVQNMFAQLLEKERFCDVTLYCTPSVATHKEAENIRGVSLRAHRVVLAACSELLGTLLGAHEAHGEPVLVIDGADPKHVKALLDYMYTGEMNVHHSQLASLLKTAEELRIKGLTDIRWNNKDEPPDCQAGNNIVTTTFKQIPPEKKQEKQGEPKREVRSPSPEAKPAIPVVKQASPGAKQASPGAKQASPGAKQASPGAKQASPEVTAIKTEAEEAKPGDKCNVNGGPPPLIKLPTKDKGSPVKRELSDTESPSPKRQRHTSANDNTDDDSISLHIERDSEWQHGNLDISAERVVGWGAGSEGGWSRDDDDEWADAPTDIGSFLHTNLRVDGDNSADEESCESTTARAQTSSTSTSASVASNLAGEKLDMLFSTLPKPTVGPKSGPTDPRFKDVVKLNDYLQHGRRPHFWEENYVKRVMEAVRLKELEMKQAAEILGVSYGTLYGRYRDVYGCINRPYRTARDFWQAKGPSEVLERLQKGEISLDTAAITLGVSAANLASYVADVPGPDSDFEPIPIEVDPSLQMKARAVTRGKGNKSQPPRRAPADDTEGLFIAQYDAPQQASNAPGKWPTIRVASIETLRADAPASPSALMRTRPDLTIVAAKKPDKADEAT